jgi:hypothetical protein
MPSSPAPRRWSIADPWLGVIVRARADHADRDWEPREHPVRPEETLADAVAVHGVRHLRLTRHEVLSRIPVEVVREFVDARGWTDESSLARGVTLLGCILDALDAAFPDASLMDGLGWAFAFADDQRRHPAPFPTGREDFAFVTSLAEAGARADDWPWAAAGFTPAETAHARTSGQMSREDALVHAALRGTRLPWPASLPSAAPDVSGPGATLAS